MRLLIVNNLSSGFQDGMIYDFMRLTVDDGDEVVMRCTDGTTPAESLVDDAASFDAVVVSGGDGTITSVATRLAFSGVPILPFPAGTGNLLASNLMSPLEPHSLARMVHDGYCLDFDLGMMKVAGEEHGFCIMAGCGYDAAIMQGAEPTKRTLGPIAYFQSAFANIKVPVAKMRLTIDGKTLKTKGLGIVIVNFPRIQFDIPLTHGTSAQDGLFQVCVLKAENALQLLPAFLDSIRDREGNHPYRGDTFEVYTGKSVELISDPPLPIQYDGESPELTSPLSAYVMERAARFIVSEETYRQLSAN